MATSTRRSTPRRAAGRRATPMTPEDLTGLRILSSPQISPDGRTVLFVHKQAGEKNEYATNIWSVEASGTGEPKPFTSGGRDSHPRWSPDGRRIAFISARTKHRPQIHVMSVDGGESAALTALPEGSIGALKWSPDGSLIAFTFREQDPEWTEDAKKKREEAGLTDPPRVLDDWWYRLDGDGYFNAQRYRLHLVDTTTGETRMIYGKDALGFLTFDFSPDSKRIAITTNRDRKAMIRPWKDEILIATIADGRLKPVPGLPRGPKYGVAWSPDGKLLAYAGREGDDDVYSVENLELWVCEPGRGRARSLTGGEDFCLMATTLTDTSEASFEPSLQWTPDSRRVVVGLGWHGETHVASVGAAGGTIRWHTSGASAFDAGNISRDGKRIALVRATTTRPGEVYVGILGSRATPPRSLTSLNAPLLAERALADIRSHWVRTADKTKVQVWIMMPPDHRPGSRRRYPAVLEIHGGPHAQYGVGFFHEFQVLAAQGYMVVFSNPRGSKGYGRDHCAAIRGAWGGADWTDLQAVIGFMQGHRHVDAGRMGIMGGSYGGYMTNWAIGHCHDFVAAITDRCVSNVVTMGGTSDFVDAPDRYFPGNFWDRPEARWEQSPIRYVGNARTPTLIIHSEGDLRCNIEQAEQLFNALKLLNVPTRLIRYPRATSHGMSRGGPIDMRLHRLHRILEWWAKYLKKSRKARKPRSDGATKG